MTHAQAQQIFTEVIELYAQYMPDFNRGRVNPCLNFNKSTNALGTCKTTLRNGKIIGCEIFLSIYAMNNIQSVYNTLAHEIAHTFDGCQNHSARFKAVGKRFERYTGIVIDTHATEEDSKASGIREAQRAQAKYILRCINCGNEWYYQRMGKAVTNYQSCNCGKCGKVKGKLQLIRQ